MPTQMPADFINSSQPDRAFIPVERSSSQDPYVFQEIKNPMQMTAGSRSTGTFKKNKGTSGVFAQTSKSSKGFYSNRGQRE